MKFDIAAAEDDLARDIEAQLLSDLRQQLPQSENRQFIFSATGDTGTLVGGVTANTSYGWLLIKTLWVHKDYRRLGLGKKLLEQAESAGKGAGCHSAWLDTSNPCARLFYDKQAYQVFAELQNFAGQSPDLHRRWFMKKIIVQAEVTKSR